MDGKKDTAPCLNCERRCVGCHGSCEDYARADRLRQERKATIRKAKDAEAIYAAYAKNSASHKISEHIREQIRKRRS